MDIRHKIRNLLGIAVLTFSICACDSSNILTEQIPSPGDSSQPQSSIRNNVLLKPLTGSDGAGNSGTSENKEQNITPAATSAPVFSGSQTQNKFGMKFNLIPAGVFSMGSPEYEFGRFPNEHQVQVSIGKSFYLQTTEVTQAQWESVLGKKFTDHVGRYAFGKSYGEGDDYPMYYVTWNDVNNFITELNKKDEGTYRLPSEAEWEYSARARTTGAYSCSSNSDSETCLDSMGWYDMNSQEKVHPVGQKLPNAWGLYDMHGNVLEWVTQSAKNFPEELQSDLMSGRKSDVRKFVRGGSWITSARSTRSAATVYARSEDKHNYGGLTFDTLSYSYIGFRLVRED